MNNDFSKPQRQSAAGIVILALHSFYTISKSLIIPIIIALVKMRLNHLVFLGIAFVALLALCLFFAWLWYLRFTFYLDTENQEFVVNKGIFNRDQLIIQLDKIQQVNIDQSLLQKIIGIYGVKIDTAGAKGEEVNIRAIHESAAHLLRDHLLSRSHVQEINEQKNASEADRIPFLKISSKTLFKVGLTSHYGQSIALLVTFCFFVFQEGRQLMEAFQINKDQLETAVKGVLTLFSIAILILGLMLILLIINMIRIFYTYFDLQISKHHEAMLLSSGLLAKKNTVISPGKVQVSKYSQNFFQRKLDMVNLSLKQAQFGSSKQGKEMQGSTLRIPGCSPVEKDHILKMILGELPANGQVFIPNWRFINLPVFFRLIIPVLILYIMSLNVAELKPFLPWSSAYVLVGILMIIISFKRHQIVVSEDFIVKRSGIWDVSREIIIPAKIQAVTVSQYPWHKGLDIGHLCLHTAAGQIRFKYGNYSEIKRLSNFWLYQLESSREDWM